MDVPPPTSTFVPAAPPILTVAPAAKFVPVIVTGVPPAVGPPDGAMLLTVGGAVYVKPLPSVPLLPPTLVATTGSAPAACGGGVAVIDVAVTTTTVVAAVAPL